MNRVSSGWKRRIALVLCGVILGGVIFGGYCLIRNRQLAEESRLRFDSINRMKALLLAMHNYVDDLYGEREGQESAWPEKLEDLIPEMGESFFNEVMHNPITGDFPGYEYVRPPTKGLRGLDSANTVVLIQLSEGKRDMSLPVCYADGHIGPFKKGATEQD